MPGTPGLEHRVGGLEKEAVSGNVSYDPANHQLMTDTRAWKVANIANDIPKVEVDGDVDANVLVLGWGSTFGPIRAAARRARLEGKKVATAHLRHLNPMPANLGEVLGRYRRVLVPEMNLGQLSLLLRARFDADIQPVTKVSGMAFRADELHDALLAEVAGTLAATEDAKTRAAVAAVVKKGDRA